MENTEDERFLRTRFGHHATAGFVSALVVRILALLLVKILVSFLSKSDYGTYSLWMAFVLLLSTFSTSSFSATLWRYLQKKYRESPEDASRLISASFMGPIIIITIIFSGLFISFSLFGVRIINDSLYLASLAITTVLTIFYILKELVLVISGTEQNSREILIFNLTFGFMSVAVGSLLAIIFGSFLLALIGLSLGYAIPVFISLGIKLKQYRLARFTKKEIRLVAEFGGPMVIVNSSSSAVTFVTSLAVSIWIGFAGVGTLSISQILAVLPSFIITPALMAYYAYMVMTLETADFEKGNQLTTKVVEIFISLVTPVILLLMSFSPLLIEILSTSEYLDAFILVPFTVLAAAIISLSQFWQIRIQLVYKTYLAAGVYIMSFGVLLMSLIIFQSLGLIGVVSAILLHASTVFVGMYILGNRCMPITLRRFYFVSWLVSLVILLIVNRVSQIIGLSDMLAGIIASGAYLLCLVLTHGLKISDVRSILRIILKRT